MTPESVPFRCSVFSVGDNPEGKEHRASRMEELLDYVAEAERLGYHAFFFAEHHFDAHGELPDPWVLVGAAAERTRGGRIHLGPMVSVLSFRHPVQVAEQALLANRLSGGRVEVGVGSGNIPQEHVAFGLHPDPVARKREAFDRAFPLFVSTLQGRPVPVSAHPRGAVQVNVPPMREVPGRVWVALARPEAVLRYASEGYSVALGPPFATMKDLSVLAEQVARLRAAVPPGRGLRVASAFPVYFGPDPGAARDALDRFLVQKRADEAVWPRPPTAPAAPTNAEGLVREGLAAIGHPTEAQAQLDRLAATGITDLLVVADFGGLPPSAVRGTLEVVARWGHLRASGA